MGAGSVNERLAHARRVLRSVARDYERPLLLCSFGKDSMVVLHICRDLGFDWGIVMHRADFFPEKYRFADRIIQEWGLTMYDYPPLDASIVTGNGRVDVAMHFCRGAGDYLVPLANLVEPDNGTPMLCAVDDFLNRRTERVPAFPWDVCVAGLKACDIDSVVGPLRCERDIYRLTDGADFAFPIREWTDRDVWDYTVARSVPYHEERYERDGSGRFRERVVKDYNPDYFPCCTRCLNPEEPSTVFCPKQASWIPNISHETKRTRVTKETGPIYLA